MESHKRSMVKSIVWRVMGVIVLALVTWLYTRNIIQTSLVTFLHHFSFIWIYYLHERFWQRVKLKGKIRQLLRIFLYEIVLGYGVLGFITLSITGSWTAMTLIGITYIVIKLWMYAAYDWIWNKIVWEQR